MSKISDERLERQRMYARMAKPEQCQHSPDADCKCRQMTAQRARRSRHHSDYEDGEDSPWMENAIRYMEESNS